MIFDRLKEEIPIYDLFDIADTPVRYETKAKPCQISCPFHGADAHPSARVYPDTNTFRCFTCSKSWNAVTYWAEANNWFTNDDKLDIGRAIDDLCYRFNITNNTFDWEKKFYAIKKEYESSKDLETSFEDRLKLSTYYAWNIAKLVHTIEPGARDSSRDIVISTWDAFDSIDLQSEVWRDDLITWYRSAKIKLYEEGL